MLCGLCVAFRLFRVVASALGLTKTSVVNVCDVCTNNGTRIVHGSDDVIYVSAHCIDSIDTPGTVQKRYVSHVSRRYSTNCRVVVSWRVVVAGKLTRRNIIYYSKYLWRNAKLFSLLVCVPDV